MPSKTLTEIIAELEASLKLARKDHDRSEERDDHFHYQGKGDAYEYVLELLKGVKPSSHVWVVSWVVDRDPDTPLTSIHASEKGAVKFLTEHLAESTNCEKAKELLAEGKIQKAVDEHNDWIFHGRDGWVYDLDCRKVEP